MEREVYAYIIPNPKRLFFGKMHPCPFSKHLTPNFCPKVDFLESAFQMTGGKPKLLLRPLTTRANSVINQSEFLAVTHYLLKARENRTCTVRLG